jgi:Flp pilus assembly protein TadG
MVEFALASTMLISVMFGTFRFGYTFYQYNQLVTAIRGGTRFASNQKLVDQGNGIVPTNFQTPVQNIVVFGNIGGTGSSIVPGLTTANVKVEMFYDTKFVPQSVKVSIINFTIDAIFTQFTFNGKPSLTMPYVGQYCVGCSS